MAPLHQKEASKFYFPWQILYSAGGSLLAICLGAFIFEVFTNQKGMWDGFFGLYSPNNKDYIHWMGTFSWALAVYLALQTISMLFRDTSGHYEWRNIVYASEQIHKEAAALNATGKVYQMWSFYGNGFPRIVLILSIVTNWNGFYAWEGRPSIFTFLGVLAAVVNIALSVIVNYASTIGTLQSVHMLEEGIVERNRRSMVHQRIGIQAIEGPKVSFQIAAGKNSSPIESARPTTARPARDFDPSNVVTAEFRDPSETPRPTQKTQPRPMGASTQKIPPIPMPEMEDLTFIRKK